jgi:hypothetical protein
VELRDALGIEDYEKKATPFDKICQTLRKEAMGSRANSPSPTFPPSKVLARGFTEGYDKKIPRKGAGEIPNGYKVKVRWVPRESEIGRVTREG